MNEESPLLFSFSEIRETLPGDWIGAFHPAATVSAVFSDTRKNVPDSLFFAFPGERFDAHDFLSTAIRNGAKLLCIERSKVSRFPAGSGVPAIAVDSTVDAYQRLAHRHRLKFPALKLIALTGSCGKTSVKEMLRSILTEAYGPDKVLATEGNTNNQIGVPANLFRLNSSHRAAVIEAGTNHPGEIKPLACCAEPSGALVVSIAPCHLEFLGSLDGVAREKSHIFDFLPPDGFAVFPAHAPGVEILKQAASHVRIYTFGDQGDEDCSVQYLGGGIQSSSFRLKWHPSGEETLVRWRISGAHQARNAAAATAAALAGGLPFAAVAEGLPHTVLPGMRMRFSEHDSSVWVNDAYNANPESMKAALRNLAEFAEGRNVFLILGDMGELGDASDPGHKDVLETAKTLFPHATLFTVGEKMRRAAENLCIRPGHAWPDARSAAAAGLPSLIPPGSLVFLKGSRSMQLETIEPPDETYREKKP